MSGMDVGTSQDEQAEGFQFGNTNLNKRYKQIQHLPCIFIKLKVLKNQNISKSFS